MRFYSILISLVILFSQITTCSAATLNAFLVADTLEGEVSQGTECSIDAMHRMLKRIAANTGFDLNVQIFEGFKTHTKNLTNYFLDSQIDSNDIVVLYFAMHGCRSENKTIYWPDLIFGLEHKNYGFENFVKIFDQKQPKLLIAIADSCNVVKIEFPKIPRDIDEDDCESEEEYQIKTEKLLSQINGPTSQYKILNQDFCQTHLMINERFESNIHHLFSEANGSVIIAAASPGEAAIREPYCLGGNLTKFLISNLCNKEVDSWTDLLTIVAHDVTEASKPHNEAWEALGQTPEPLQHILFDVITYE